MRPSKNLPLPHRIYPLPFSTTTILCDPPKIYPFLPEYTSLFTKFMRVTLPEYTPSLRIYPPFNNFMRPSQDLPLPPRIYPHFQQLFYYSTLPESIPPSQNIPPFNNCIRHSPETTLPSENTPLFFDNYMPPPSLPLEIYPSSPFYNIPRIYPSVTEYAPFSRNYMQL